MFLLIRRAGAVLVTAAGLGLIGACAPQLDRIELAVQENTDEMAEMRVTARTAAGV